MNLVSRVIGFGCLACLAVLLPASPRAGCVDYTGHFHWVGGLDLPGPGYGVAVSGDLAYVVWSTSEYGQPSECGLCVVDISDPERPGIIGRADLGGERGGDVVGCGVAVSGHHVYVCNDWACMKAIDVSEPQHPVLVASLELPYPCGSLAIAGSYAYLGVKFSGLTVVDLTNPGNPVVIGMQGSERFPTDVAIAGHYACLGSTWDNEFEVVDIEVPTEPRQVCLLSVPGGTAGVTVSGDRAYAVGGTALTAIDIDDPELPRVLGSTEGFGLSIAVSGARALVAGYNNGLASTDISDPELPRWLGGAAAGYAFELAVSDDHAYVADMWGGLQVVEIGDGEVPSFSSLPVVDEYRPLKVALAGDYACVAKFYRLGSGGRLEMVHLADPEAPQVVGSLETAGGILDLAVSGNVACLCEGGSGSEFDLLVVDLAHPTHPQVIGRVPDVGPRAVAIAGSYAYISSFGAPCFRVIDLSVPEDPRVVGSVAIDAAGDLALVGNRVFLAVPGRGLEVVDVSDPRVPRILDPPMSSPPEPGSWGSQGICADADNAYVIRDDSRLEVFDVSCLHVFERVSSIRIPAEYTGWSPAATIVGDVLYVAASGLLAVDVSDRRHPSVIGGLYAGGATGVDVSDSLAVVVGPYSGMVVATPQCAQPVPAAISPSIAVGQGLRLGVYPNPGRGGSSIRMSMPGEGWVHAAICDVSGREVRVVEDGVMSLGPHDLLWDGRDERDRALPTGVYFVRVTTRWGERTTRFVSLR